MTLFELGKSSGDVPLARLIDAEPARCPDPGLTVADLAREIALGACEAE